MLKSPAPTGDPGSCPATRAPQSRAISAWSARRRSNSGTGQSYSNGVRRPPEFPPPLPSSQGVKQTPDPGLFKHSRPTERAIPRNRPKTGDATPRERDSAESIRCWCTSSRQFTPSRAARVDALLHSKRPRVGSAPSEVGPSAAHRFAPEAIESRVHVAAIREPRLGHGDTGSRGSRRIFLTRAVVFINSPVAISWSQCLGLLPQRECPLAGLSPRSYSARLARRRPDG